MPCKIHLIAAARPNFLYHALAAQTWCETRIVHTGQHYDSSMSDAFFRDLRLPTPHFHLEVGSGSHAQQTAGVMTAYEKVCEQDRPDWTIVVGELRGRAASAAREQARSLTVRDRFHTLRASHVGL